GNINPNEITSLGSELFGDALDFMGYSHEAAAQVAQEKTDYFAQAYDSLTQEEYYNNPGIASRAELYYVDGQLDTSTMYSKFYEEALKDYAQNYLMPVLKAKEEELEEKKTEIETMLEAEQAELEQVKNATSQAIQSSTIKLS
ncbi:hypothetical protein IJ670_05390, partial [bacterium]|nr:hypothetical protein [bacterium]